MLTLFLLLVTFAVLGLLGWIGQGLGCLGKFFANGITGCLGCCARAILYLIMAYMLFEVVCGIL
jgi:hypothetical protein